MVWTEEHTADGWGRLTPLVPVTFSKHKARWRRIWEELGEGSGYDQKTQYDVLMKLIRTLFLKTKLKEQRDLDRLLNR